MFFNLLYGFLISLIVLTSQAIAKPRGYFISIDGFTQTGLDLYLQKKRSKTTDRGFFQQFKNVAQHQVVSPIDITLTAPSHIGTITCSTVKQHQIIANEFVRHQQRVSGFQADFFAEPLWRAAQRQGQKVLSIAYVGADGRHAQRQATWGLAFPEKHYLTKRRNLSWPYGTLQRAQGWQTNQTIAQQLSSFSARELKLSLEINPRTHEKVRLNVLIINMDSSHPQFIIDDDKNLLNGFLAEINDKHQEPQWLYFKEKLAPPHSLGVLRRIGIRMHHDLKRKQVKMDISQATYNNAYPSSFRHLLDHHRLVWPDYSFYDPHISYKKAVHQEAILDRFLTKVAQLAHQKLDFDILLFYQRIIDAAGHDYQSELEVNPSAQEAFRAAYEEVDNNLASLWPFIKSQDIISVVGDHGMSPAYERINMKAVLDQLHLSSLYQVNSGAISLLYSQANASINQATKELARLKQHLAKLRIKKKKAIDAFLIKKDDSWPYGDALAVVFSKPPFWFAQQTASQVVLPPTAGGMHGYLNHYPHMATYWLFKADGFKLRHNTPHNSLIHVVPTFMKALNLTPPAQCLGQSLLIPEENMP